MRHETLWSRDHSRMNQVPVGARRQAKLRRRRAPCLLNGALFSALCSHAAWDSVARINSVQRICMPWVRRGTEIQRTSGTGIVASSSWRGQLQGESYRPRQSTLAFTDTGNGTLQAWTERADVGAK